MTQEQLKELLESMSLEEKIGQLFQGNGSFYEGEGIATGPMAEQGFTRQDVELAGSVLSITGAEATRKIQELHMKKHPHHIPLIFMADVINGYRTIFPIPLAQGAAFDPELSREGAEVTAAEAAAAGIHVTFSPMVDLVRDARWGRVMESTGEDPYLNSCYAEALVKGYQGENPAAEGRIGACVKHFAGYGAPVGGRDYNNVELSERTLRDDYLPAYEAAIKAGALLVMTSFNTLNRIPSTGNKWLMRDILRGEMGFQGTLISDWAAIEEIRHHGMAENNRQAAKLALEAGTDIDMMTTCYVKWLKELIQTGEVEEALLDEAVLRVLELKNKLGLFENPYKDGDLEAEKRLLLCEEHRQKARKAARETFVLLENEGMLPLKAQEKVAFIGPYTEEKNIIGSWSIFGSSQEAVNIREGVSARGVNAVFAEGCGVLAAGEEMPGFMGRFENARSVQEMQELMDQAVETAAQADKVVLCIGEHMAHTGEGASRGDITVPRGQIELLRKVAQVNDKITVVLFTGRPLDIREIKELAKAVLVVWMPGTEGGDAIADVLYGDVSPSGKLPMSFPYCAGQVPVFYGEFQTGRHFDKNHPENRFQSRYLDIPNEPLYPFGYGLTYTSFSLSQVKLDRAELKKGENLTASVNVKNTGDREAAQVIQLYIRDDVGSVVRPVRQLKGFRKVFLKPGQEQEISFVITEEMLRFYDKDMIYRAEEGTFTVFVGEDSRTDNQAVFTLL